MSFLRNLISKARSAGGASGQGQSPSIEEAEQSAQQIAQIRDIVGQGGANSPFKKAWGQPRAKPSIGKLGSFNPFG